MRYQGGKFREKREEDMERWNFDKERLLTKKEKKKKELICIMYPLNKLGFDVG